MIAHLADYDDNDPEDAWDDGDSAEDKVAILEAVVAQLATHHDDRFEFRRVDALRLAAKVKAHRRLKHRLRAVRDALENL